MVESNGTLPLRYCIVHTHLDHMVLSGERHIHSCTAERVHLQQGRGSLLSRKVQVMYTSHLAGHWERSGFLMA